jgi:hypothetical protein
VRDAVLTSIREYRHAGAGAGRPKAEARAAAARQRRAALGKNAKTAAAAGQGVGHGSSRSQRYRARSWLSEVRTETSQKRWRDCGRAPVTEGGEVQVRVSETGERRSAGVGGVASCGSVWACPVCSAKIAARRTSEIEQVLAWNAARGGSVALATFTMRHHSGHRLKSLRTALQAAWRHITEHRTWKKTRKQLGCDEYIRAIECTYGENGWHLHIHVVLIFDGPISAEMVEDWTDELYGLWSDGLAMNNMEASREHGVDVRVGQGALDGLGKYLSKLTYESAGGRFKKGRKGGRTPFELLDDAINHGNADDWDAWFEWEAGSKGMRQITPSRKLWERAGLGKQSKDEEITEEDEGGDTLAHIAPSSWKWLYWHVGELLDVIEQQGTEAGLSWLDLHEVTFELGKQYE